MDWNGSHLLLPTFFFIYLFWIFVGIYCAHVCPSVHPSIRQMDMDEISDKFENYQDGIINHKSYI